MAEGGGLPRQRAGGKSEWTSFAPGPFELCFEKKAPLRP